MKLTATELRRLFANVPVVIAPDRDYLCPTRRWLLGQVYDSFAGFLGTYGQRYERQFDCDDFARTFAVWAVLENAQRTKDAEGIAVGELFYRRRDGGGHAINVAVLEDKKTLYIEPQTGRPIRLNKDEVGSIWFVRF